MSREVLPSTTDPLASRRRLGAELRRLREAAGFYLDDAAGYIECSTAKLSRLENGIGVPRVRDVRDLLEFYRVRDNELRDRLLGWAQEGRSAEWWPDLRDSWKPNLDKFISLEAEASAIKICQAFVVPGLLQTYRYAYSVIEEAFPGREDEELTYFTNVRIQRQEFWLNRESPANVIAILDESILSRSVSSPAVHREQIDHLIDLSKHSFCDIRIHPFSAGIHPGYGGNFILLEKGFTEKYISLDMLHETKLLKTQSQVACYTKAFDQVLLRCLSKSDSIDFLARLRADL